MQTSLRRRYRDRVVRRGIGMTIESDFYATDVGRQHFRDQLTSIRFCVRSAIARSDGQRASLTLATFAPSHIGARNLQL